MNKPIKGFLTATLCLFYIFAFAQDRANFKNLINLTPGADGLKEGYLFADLGNWHGYGISDTSGTKNAGGFKGPGIIRGRKGIIWLSDSFLNFQPLGQDKHPIAYTKINAATYLPGMLMLSSSTENLTVTLKHIAVSSRSTMTIVYVTNTGKQKTYFKPHWSGQLNELKAVLSKKQTQINVDIENGKSALVLSLPLTVNEISLSPKQYNATGQTVELNAGKTVSFVTYTTFSPDGGLPSTIAEIAMLQQLRPESALKENQKRWNKYLSSVFSKKTQYLKTPRFKQWAVKAVMTLNTNWRSAAGDLRHAGVVPATGHFDAFWAWDSWEHAAALSLFNPTLAKEQMKVMFDEQTPEGMIIDLLSIDKRENNTKCSKPPLAGWATYQVYQRTRDIDFVKYMYPKLMKFHQWRFKYRDHDQNGLCEYGGTGDNVAFAQWESGMDVAVKFNGAKMLYNAPGAYSIDQESIELNSYLCAEKFYLAYLAKALGKPEEALALEKQGVEMKQKIQSLFYDQASGYFYDRKIATGALVKIIDISGWIPLFTGVATNPQAESVKKNMLDPIQFGTYFPFSTLNHTHPLYNPEKGYFRGQTWMNYTYFGIRGFKNYGFTEAEQLTRQIPEKFKGIADPGFAIRESYSSADGHGLDARHFSWSSAFSLLLMTEDADQFNYIPYISNEK